jgi:alpha-tubulin suppressor-like RCC1 family protein
VLYTWGRGVFGQLGHYNNESYNTPVKVNSLYQTPVIQVACGWQHTAALTSDGKMFTWGYGEDGQLGHGDANDYIVPKQLEQLAHMRITQVACGHSHSGCVAEGRLYMWGCNPDCRLFIPNTDTKLAPQEISVDGDVVSVSLGVSHSALVTEAGEVVMAGLG